MTLLLSNYFAVSLKHTTCAKLLLANFLSELTEESFLQCSLPSPIHSMQMNLFTRATMGTEESGHCRELPLLEV